MQAPCRDAGKQPSQQASQLASLPLCQPAGLLAASLPDQPCASGGSITLPALHTIQLVLCRINQLCPLGGGPRRQAGCRQEVCLEACRAPTRTHPMLGPVPIRDTDIEWKSSRRGILSRGMRVRRRPRQGGAAPGQQVGQGGSSRGAATECLLQAPPLALSGARDTRYNHSSCCIRRPLSRLPKTLRTTPVARPPSLRMPA